VRPRAGLRKAHAVARLSRGWAAWRIWLSRLTQLSGSDDGPISPSPNGMNCVCMNVYICMRLNYEKKIAVHMTCVA
jgi:hypothetical protein